MWNSTDVPEGAGQTAEMLGDVQDLAGQLAPAPGLNLAPARVNAPADSLAALQSQLGRYSHETLAQHEWPVILQAWQFAREGKTRELLALDQAWGQTARHQQFAEASFRVGRRQLNKLRGLRHERVIARYLEAIDAGQAHGWHPVVYGVVLAVYHLPLRQGLMQFAAKSLTGLAHAAERSGKVPARACQTALQNAVTLLPSHLPPLPSPERWASV